MANIDENGLLDAQVMVLQDEQAVFNVIIVLHPFVTSSPARSQVTGDLREPLTVENLLYLCFLIYKMD